MDQEQLNQSIKAAEYEHSFFEVKMLMHLDNLHRWEQYHQ